MHLNAERRSATCRVDVACATTPHARSVRDAVARIRFEKTGGTLLCTAVGPGELRLSGGEDARRKPYLLTANPCVNTVGGAQGFVHVHNNEDRGIEVDVVTYDDAGARYEGTTVRLEANRAMGHNTRHPELGDEKRALPCIGDREGLWRLQVSTALDIAFLGHLVTQHRIGIRHQGDRRAGPGARFDSPWSRAA